MSDNTSLILEVAQNAARQAGALLLEKLGHADIHEKQSTQNLVTEADLASEQLISDLVLDRFPDHVMMKEETEFDGEIGAAHLWVVDPLDATNNYAHGIPHFCVSIAYAQAGVVQVGVVYDPSRDEMFCGVRGSGATLNGEQIAVSQPTGLNRSIIATGFYYDRGLTMERTLESIATLFRINIRGLRRMGAAALDLCWIACGRFEGYFEYQLAPWDYAAGALIVAEAGGACFDRAGQPLTLESRSVVAGSSAIIQDLVDHVKWDG